MKDFIKTFFILLSSGFLFSGCAGSLSVYELMDTHTEVNSAPTINASLGVVVLEEAMFNDIPLDVDGVDVFTKAHFNVFATA